MFATKTFKLPSTYVEKTLIGLVVCNTISSFISLSNPINLNILLLLTFLGLVSILFIKSELKAYVLALAQYKFVIIYFFSFLITAFFIALNQPENYDSGLYHIQSIKWIEEYSVVPGLANLHGRFGFNPNIFTLFSLTSLNDIFKQEIFSINYTIFAIIVFYFINHTYSIFKQQNFSPLFIFNFFLFLVILKLPNLSSPSPDFIGTVIPLFIYSRIISMSNNQKTMVLKNYIPILILCIYVITVKLSTLPIILLPLFIVIKYKSEFPKKWWLFMIFSLIVIPWLARNIITTGWMLYPFPSLDLFSFSWEVPLENVVFEKESITGWARNPGIDYIKTAQMSFRNWFPIWWKNVPLSDSVFLLFSIFFPPIIFLAQLIKKRKIDFFTNTVILSSFIGVLFWFFTAPDWRFGQCFILVASISPLLVLQYPLRISFKPIFAFSIIALFLLSYYTIGKLSILYVIITSFFMYKSYQKSAYQTRIFFGTLILVTLFSYVKQNYSKISTNSSELINLNYVLVPPKIDSPANLSFKKHKINNTNIYVPAEGDRCFDHTIPCTPYFDSSIVLIGNTFQSGFMNKSNKK
ncbi:MAG: hypothetical protein JNL69_03255 [Bacteroidia bacterium]|nr:hypothetical protein [Bacteroidia bacterium]